MEGMGSVARDSMERRRRLRIVIPAYPSFNIYSGVAKFMTALGPVSVATSVHDVEGWDVEVIDENNYGRSAPKDHSGLPDHGALQRLRPADVVGFYGGLSSTIPRLYAVARFYQGRRIPTIAGGQHFIEENIMEGLRNGIDVIAIGEGQETIKELLFAFEGKRRKSEIPGIAYLDHDRLVQNGVREPLTHFDRLPMPDFSWSGTPS